MGDVTKLAPVIKIDEEKCINCYACVTACPVKYCLDGSGEKLQVNHDLCIGCGNCIASCHHHARLPVDDTARFFNDLGQGVKMIATVAPAIASFMPGKYLNFNGYLKSLGVEAVFDVSFGAELTVVSYLDYIKKKNPRTVISQPCPAIVTFIELYHPELLPHLAPADSPMLHSMKLIREYYPQYKNHKIVVISPCIAKRREFDETGYGDYNVTMRAMKKHLEDNKISLDSFPSVQYEGEHAERAVRFSTPGGLLDTAERFIPGIRRRTTKIEGVHTIYPYLSEISELLHTDTHMSLLVDCLNCEKGCNGGPGTGHQEKPKVTLENPIQARSAKLEEYHKHNKEKGEWVYKKYHRILNRFWKKDLYNRSYRDLSANFATNIKIPTDEELKEVFKSMKKFTQADMYDCTACGYGSCKSMARAIFNHLNKPDNCAHYNLHLLGEEKKTVVFMNQQLKDHITRALELIEVINNLVEKLNGAINTQADSVNASSDVTGKIVTSLKNTSDLSRQKRESVIGLIENAGKGQEAMQETIQEVENISESVDGIASAIKIISVIAANTNLLAMNAAIEAAHAGEAGRGFAVVADEIRRLSESTRENSRNISQTLSEIIGKINTTTRRSGDAGNIIDHMSSEINGVANTMTELIDTLGRLSTESTGVTSSLDTLKENSNQVQTDYTQMLSLTDKLRYDINFLAAMSGDIVRAMENDDQDLMAKLFNMESKEAAHISQVAKDAMAAHDAEKQVAPAEAAAPPAGAV